MFNSVYDYPSIVRSTMGGAVNLVYARGKLFSVREECLAVGENQYIRRSGYLSIQLIIETTSTSFIAPSGNATRKGMI
jgi:hypothetical protein